MAKRVRQTQPGNDMLSGRSTVQQARPKLEHSSRGCSFHGSCNQDEPSLVTKVRIRPQDLFAFRS